MATPLTPEQKQAVGRWVGEGCGISEVQRRLGDQFQLTMAYMDVRLLLIEMGLELKDKRASTGPAVLGKPAAEPEPPPLPGALEEEALEPASAEPPPAGGGSVQIEVDRIMRPGALVSGSVRFSDGVKATWMLDQSGRLALDAGKPSYRPSAGDVRDFQVALEQALRKMGY